MPNFKTSPAISPKRSSRSKVKTAPQAPMPTASTSRPQKWRHYTTWHIVFSGVEMDSDTARRVREEIPWKQHSTDGKLLFITPDASEMHEVSTRIVDMLSEGGKDCQAETYSLTIEDQAQCPKCGKLGRFQDRRCLGCGATMVAEIAQK